ncbi:hypothetical protein [Nocardia transvalensis]|uniref:hypothetical protein n=1 Tax=Nocardia transvalensis TaxID=37333 RepID=UPI0018960149|nr:hypothetical protein [Nocardia transvalensis]MBF6328883.1 hypothetical protein [Nocardia transvalensis]
MLLRRFVYGAVTVAGLAFAAAPSAFAAPIEQGFRAADGAPCGQSTYSYSGYDFTRWNNCSDQGVKLGVSVRGMGTIERCIGPWTTEDIGGAGSGTGTVESVEVRGTC